MSNATLPRLANGADTLWNLLPGWYRARDEKANGVLRALCDILGTGLDSARADVLRLLDNQFIETCHPDLIPLMGDLLGAKIEPTIPVARRRHQVLYAIHLARRKGTIPYLETLVWQLTGAGVRVVEAPTKLRSTDAPCGSARISGSWPVHIESRSQRISGAPPVGSLVVYVDAAWPVQRVSRRLINVGTDIHAVDEYPVGLRRADGRPIFVHDDAAALVGPGKEIDINLAEADLPRLGSLYPVFMNLGSLERPFVPDRCLAIDPERGRVAGPTAPMPGVMAWRSYQLTFWQAIRSERPHHRATHLGNGLYSFAQEGEIQHLCDENAVRLIPWRENEGAPPIPSSEERILVIRDPAGGRWGEPTDDPFVIMPAGVAVELLETGSTMLDSGQGLDHAGMNRFFSIEDSWEWDLFQRYQFLDRLVSEPADDQTVHVDLRTGRFRAGVRWREFPFEVRLYRPARTEMMLKRAEAELRRVLPLGRQARIIFRDTAPGVTRRS